MQGFHNTCTLYFMDELIMNKNWTYFIIRSQIVISPFPVGGKSVIKHPVCFTSFCCLYPENKCMYFCAIYSCSLYLLYYCDLLSFSNTFFIIFLITPQQSCCFVENSHLVCLLEDCII